MKAVKTWAGVITFYAFLYIALSLFSPDARANIDPYTLEPIAPQVRPVYFAFYICGELVAVAGNNADVAVGGTLSHFDKSPGMVAVLANIRKDAQARQNAYQIDLTDAVPGRCRPTP